MTALAHRWMRNPSLLQLLQSQYGDRLHNKSSAAPDCLHKVKITKQNRRCVCHLIVQSLETLSLCMCLCLCVKKVIRPLVQTALSANNNGYFLLLSLSLSAQCLCPGLLADRCAEITPSNCF